MRKRKISLRSGLPYDWLAVREKLIWQYSSILKMGAIRQAMHDAGETHLGAFKATSLIRPPLCLDEYHVANGRLLSYDEANHVRLHLGGEISLLPLATADLCSELSLTQCQILLTEHTEKQMRISAFGESQLLTTLAILTAVPLDVVTDGFSACVAKVTFLLP